ncbi:MAG: restriction endonuclease [Leptospirillum sp.]|jgi:hypothetical protein
MDADTEEKIQKTLKLGGLISDWGGFEKLVAKLNETGHVTVEHNVKMVGRSGAPRQIDVLIRHKEGLYEHLIIIDCKHWKERVSRAQVDALATSVRELNASRGVLFSVMGFESGAVTQAKAEGIDLFTVREPTDEEWGLPGRYVDFYLTTIEKALRNMAFLEMTADGAIQPIHLNLMIGDPATQTQTSIEPRIDIKAADIETYFEALVDHSTNQLWPTQVLFDGSNGTRSFWKHVDIVMNEPIIIPQDTVRVRIPKISFDLGLKIHQKRIQIDRGSKYAFVLAVDDCVRGVTQTAVREGGDAITTVSPVKERKTEDSGPTFQNGSIFKVTGRMYFDFNELADLANGVVRDEIEMS